MPGLTEHIASSPRLLVHQVHEEWRRIVARVIVRTEGELLVTEEGDKLRKTDVFETREAAIKHVHEMNAPYVSGDEKTVIGAVETHVLEKSKDFSVDATGT